MLKNEWSKSNLQSTTVFDCQGGVRERHWVGKNDSCAYNVSEFVYHVIFHNQWLPAVIGPALGDMLHQGRLSAPWLGVPHRIFALEPTSHLYQKSVNSSPRG